MKRQRNTIQMKEQTWNTEVQINEKEIGNLPQKRIQSNDNKDEPNLGKRMEAHTEKTQEMFNTELEDLKNKQADE